MLYYGLRANHTKGIEKTTKTCTWTVIILLSINQTVIKILTKTSRSQVRYYYLKPLYGTWWYVDFDVFVGAVLVPDRRNAVYRRWAALAVNQRLLLLLLLQRWRRRCRIVFCQCFRWHQWHFAAVRLRWRWFTTTYECRVLRGRGWWGRGFRNVFFYISHTRFSFHTKIIS